MEKFCACPRTRLLILFLEADQQVVRGRFMRCSWWPTPRKNRSASAKRRPQSAIAPSSGRGCSHNSGEAARSPMLLPCGSPLWRRKGPNSRLRAFPLAPPEKNKYGHAGTLRARDRLLRAGMYRRKKSPSVLDRCRRACRRGKQTFSSGTAMMRL